MMKSKKELFRNEWKYLISEGEKELLRLRMSPFLHIVSAAVMGVPLLS